MASVKKGQWISTVQGIAQVIRHYRLYCEEFSAEVHMGNAKVGDFDRTLICYKILCDCYGKLRKRKFYDTAHVDLCEPLDEEALAFVETLKTDNHEYFEKWSSREFDEESVGMCLSTNVMIKEGHAQRFKHFVRNFSSQIEKPFNYPEFCRLFGQQDEFLLDCRRTEDDHYYYDRGFVRKQLLLLNKAFRTKNKRALFTEIRGPIGS